MGKISDWGVFILLGYLYLNILQYRSDQPDNLRLETLHATSLSYRFIQALERHTEKRSKAL